MEKTREDVAKKPRASREFVINRIGKERWNRESPYHPSYCDILHEIMSDGGSIWEVARELDVCVKTLYNWRDGHQEFACAFNRAKDHSLAYFANLQNHSMYDKNYNEKMWRNHVRLRHKGALDTDQTIYVKSYSESLKDIVKPEIVEKIISGDNE